MIDKLNELIVEGEAFTFSNNSVTKPHGTFGYLSVQMQSWVAEVENFILTFYGNKSSPWGVFNRFEIDVINGNYSDKFDEQKDIIMSALRACERIKPSTLARLEDTTLHLQHLLGRFHLVTRQLRIRHKERPTLKIEDEYDVQDLLHALKISFDDVRPEEYVPSYAGASSRTDFLLKAEKIIVEVKMASVRLTDKLIGEQLIIDIQRYQMHPDCERLVCFVYDPEGHIRNPVALENDLSGKNNKILVNVVVVPESVRCCV